jgi:maleate isomerase
MIAMTRGTARIGVLVPSTNTNLEADMALLRPNGISLHFARLRGHDRDEIPDVAQMAGQQIIRRHRPLFYPAPTYAQRRVH